MGSGFSIFYTNPRVSGLFVLLIFVLGLAALNGLPRQEDPALTERFATVTSFLPGANAERVESLVTEVIETGLREIPEIAKLESRSRAGVSVIQIELGDDIGPLETDNIWSEVRDKVESLRPQLPLGTLPPEVEKRAPIAATLIVAVSWADTNEPQLSLLTRIAEEISVRMANLDGTKETAIYGEIEEEVLVSVDQRALSTRGITLEQIAARIAAADTRAPAGTLNGEHNNLLLEVSGELDSVERIAAIPLQTRGDTSLRLADVATVAKAARTPPPTLAFANAARAVLVEIKMEPNRRVDRWTAMALQTLDDFRTELPSAIQVEVVFNQNEYTSGRLSSLTYNLLASLALVILVLFVFMGGRAAIAVGSVLPLAIAITLAGLLALDMPLHQMSVTGLVIAIGLLIDNAIVVVDEYQQQRAHGTAPTDAIKQSTQRLLVPLFASTATTVLAFLPIATAPGGVGEFTGSIGISVILSVSASFLLAITLTPAFAAFSERYARNRKWWDYGYTNERWANAYRRLLDRVIEKPVRGLWYGLPLPLIGFALAPTLTQQFFPPTDRNQFQVQLTLPRQASIYETERAVAAARTILEDTDGITESHWVLGEGAPRVYYNAIVSNDGLTNFAGAFVTTTSADATHALLRDLQAKLREALPQAMVLTLPFEQGPPFDAPIEVRIEGTDLAALRRMGEQVRRVFADTPGVTYTTASIGASAPQLRIIPNENTAAQTGVSLSQLPTMLAAQLSGIQAGSIQEGTQALPIRVRAHNDERNTVQSLDGITWRQSGGVGAQSGTTLDQIASVKLEPVITDIDRHQGRRVNRIQGYLEPYLLPATIKADFEQRLAESGFQAESGYRLSAGGEEEERGESVTKLLSTFATYLTIMVAVVVLSLNSFRQAGIVFFVALLSVGLALFGVRLFGYPFGFNALIGTLGMIGLAVNGTIIVLSVLRASPAALAGEHVAIRETVFRATRHILSTTITTMIGFSPLILMGGDFWPPLATAIAGGVGGSAILALITVPALFVWFVHVGDATDQRHPVGSTTTIAATPQQIAAD